MTADEPKRLVGLGNARAVPGAVRHPEAQTDKTIVVADEARPWESVENMLGTAVVS